MRALFLSAHTDDSELGCGGTIVKLIDHCGIRVDVAAFSYCHNEDLRAEFKSAMGTLLVGARSHTFDFPVRNFDKHRQEILDKMIKLREVINPDMVFIHGASDLHQDHGVIYHEALRAFKNCTIYGYELPWNNITFNTTSFFVLSEEQMKRKVNALKHYKSQAHRPYMKEDFQYSLARVRGTQIGVEYAEAFEVIRIIQ